ncbi:MAG: two-component sensor histidine kinase [Pseudobutyrivibrio sp.]|nr:two-component sensor histidine kinase [Pseudobutyrivibrio sp.]
MKQRINYRLTWLAVIAVIITSISVTFAYYSFFEEQVHEDMRVTAKILKDTEYFDTANYQELEEKNTLENVSLRVTLIDVDGTVLYDNVSDAKTMENHKNRPEVKSAFEKGNGDIVRTSDTVGKNNYYYAIKLDNGMVLRISRQVDAVLMVFVKALPLVFIIIVFIIQACVIISHLLAKRLMAPIEKLALNIEEYSDEYIYPELEPFIRTIRKQHADILSAAKARQDFTANVSHELKTPLTAITGYAQLLHNHEMPVEQQDHFATEIEKNSDRLLVLIEDIIRLSELDDADSEEGFEEFDLFALAKDGINALEINAQKKNILLSIEGESTIIRGRQDLIRELIDNLVQNAIRYNSEGGHVWVQVKNVNNRKLLIVKDDGIGIPVDDKERVFERFYRVDKSRSKATGGTGLGLAIVKHIAEIHDARISLDSTLGAGTTFTIEF